MRRLRAVVAGVALAAALAACGDDGDAARAEAAYVVEQPATLGPGDAVAPPEGAVVLTLSGRIATTNDGDLLQLDLATLERLRIVSYTVDDEQAEGAATTFSGVLLADLLALARADDDARTLAAVALNDYRVDIPTDDVDKYPVMIATRVNGERMPVERFGPLRVVYPNRDFRFDATVYDQRWIWQLSSIEVR